MYYIWRDKSISKKMLNNEVIENMGYVCCVQHQEKSLRKVFVKNV